MSMLRPILRSITCGALRSATWAEDRVFDSDLTPLATAVFGGPAKPYIVVYTDSDDLNPVDQVAQLYRGDNRTLSIAIEIGVASAVRNTTGDIVIKFAATNSGMEWACDVTAAQTIAALVGDPLSPWGDLFKRMITKVRRIPSRRGGMSQQGVRFAARRLVFQVQPMWDFLPGVIPAPAHPVWDFLALARAQPLANQVDVATIVESLMTKVQAPDWRVAQAQLGLSTDAIQTLNTGVPLGEPYTDPTVPTDEFPPPLTEITVLDFDQTPAEQTDTTPIITPGPPADPNPPPPDPFE